MKSLVKTGLAIGVLFIASTGYSAELTGTWNIGATKCLSGAALNPAASTLSGTFAFTPTTMTLVVPDQGCVLTFGPAAITITADKITPVSEVNPASFTCPGAPVQSGEATLPALDYVLNENALTLTAPASGPDQACPVGDREVIDLTRAN